MKHLLELSRWLFLACLLFVCCLALSMILCGCTSTKVTTEHWTVERVLVLQEVEIPHLTVTEDGRVEITDYTNDGGEKLAAQIAEKVIRLMFPNFPKKE